MFHHLLNRWSSKTVKTRSSIRISRKFRHKYSSLSSIWVRTSTRYKFQKAKHHSSTNTSRFQSKAQNSSSKRPDHSSTDTTKSTIDSKKYSSIRIQSSISKTITTIWPVWNVIIVIDNTSSFYRWQISANTSITNEWRSRTSRWKIRHSFTTVQITNTFFFFLKIFSIDLVLKEVRLIKHLIKHIHLLL